MPDIPEKSTPLEGIDGFVKVHNAGREAYRDTAEFAFLQDEERNKEENI